MRGREQRVVASLLDLAEELTRENSLQERMERLCQVTVRTLACDRSSIFLAKGGVFRGSANYGNPPDIAALFPQHKVSLQDPLIREAFARKSYILIDDAPRSVLMDQRTAKRARIDSLIIAPLLDPDAEPLGFLTAEYNENPGKFDELDSTLVLGVAKLAEAMIAMDRLKAVGTEAEKETTQLALRVRDLERLESIGRLAGGVAHDFNNLLTVVLGNASILEETSDLAEDSREHLHEITEAAEKARDLTTQLLAFGRRQVRDLRVFDLPTVVNEMLPILRRLVPETVEIVVRASSDTGAVRADRSQLEQVVLNLVLNARDTLPQGGRIMIETSSEDLSAMHRSEPGSESGRVAILSVTDDGPGIPVQYLAHIFEPFFSTKEATKGTGLGLATVHGIVEQSGGSIHVSSEPGQGTRFEVRLPSTEGGGAPSSPPRGRSKAGGGEVVLVVDDDSSVRAVMCSALKAGGYVIMEAGSPAEALRIEPAHLAGVDLLVTDVVMPGSSGRDLELALRDRLPDLKVLYVSGYAESTIVHHGVLLPDIDFLAKPFSSADLVFKVGEVLAR